MGIRSVQRFQFDALVIDHESSLPIFRQLEDQLRNAITHKTLRPNERLPSTRQLAKQLNLSRNTIVSAYDALIHEGFLMTSHGSGTCVSTTPPIPPNLNTETKSALSRHNISPSKVATLSEHIDHIVPHADGSTSQPFRAHTPACKEFPASLWGQLMTHRLRSHPTIWMERNHPCGYTPLREAISAHLGAARGILAKPEEVVVTAGTQQSIELLAKLLINPGDLVCFEEPGYSPASVVFEMAQATVARIPVDDEGICVEYLETHVHNAKVLYVTPSSHFPLGMCMSLARRHALLHWAKNNNTLIIEDDYNGEYRYDNNPLPALHALATTQTVFYLGSFSKLLFPALRLGYMLAPPGVLSRLTTLRWLIDRHSPTLEQAVLADFINEGHFARHLRKMRHLYMRRQHVLVTAAKKYLEDIIEIPPLTTGLHLIGWLKPPMTEAQFLALCQQAHVEAMGVSRFATTFCTPGIIFGYAPYDESDIESGIRAIANAWHRENTEKVTG